MKSGGFLKSSWTLVGILVGAGIIGMPYVIQKAGFLTGILVMAIVSILMTLINLYLGEIIISTKEKHQLTGYAEKYLGNKGKWAMFLANVLSIYGAMVAYMIGAGYALNALFPGDKFVYSIVFFVFFSIMIYFSINIISNAEYLLSPLKFIIVLLLGISLIPIINFSNIIEFNIRNIMIPYGVIVFGLTSVSAIPLMNEELKNKKNMKKAIIAGMALSVFIYFIFSFSIIGAFGDNINEVVTVSFGKLGSLFNITANLFALLAMSTAFLALSFALKENYMLDLKLKNSKSWILTIIFPFIIFLINPIGFIKILEITGAIAIAFILIMIILMHNNIIKKRNRIPEYSMPKSFLIKFIILLILIIGITYETIILLF